MGRFRNTETGVVFSVSDDKDERFGSGPYETATVSKDEKPAPRQSSKSDKS